MKNILRSLLSGDLENEDVLLAVELIFQIIFIITIIAGIAYAFRDVGMFLVGGL